MKTYNIFKKNNNKSTNNNTNSAANKMNNDFINQIYAFAPYLKSDYNKTAGATFTAYLKPNKVAPKINSIDLNDFITAAKFLSKYDFEDNGHDDYDFELFDGTPVKLFSDEIQIGYDFYPIEMFNNIDILNILAPKKKKTIIDIAIKLAA